MVKRFPQREKFKGVIKTAANVAMAVKLTDKARFPFASDEIKFEIFPPGHAAIRIIPRPTVGVIKFRKITTKRKVTNGSSKN